MNQRIRELAEQAWNDTREKFGSFVDDGGEIDYAFLHAYDQKFAELIVQRTLGIVEAHTEIFQSDQARAMVEHIKHSVKTDFGVK